MEQDRMISHLAIPPLKGLYADIASRVFLFLRWYNIVAFPVFLIFLLNFKSWPFAWHVRVFKTTIPFLPTKLAASLSKGEDKLALMDKHLPIGANPFDHRVTYTSRAWFDDCDFFFHMSNSAYSKALDAAIMKTVMHSFPVFLELGGYTPLGAVNFHFRKQINLLVQYIIRVRIATWDDKWIYFVSEFVVKGTEEILPVSDRLLYSFKNSDSSSNVTSTSNSHRSPGSRSKAPANAIAVSKLCFKYGRITIPPNLILATSGFCTPEGGAYAPTSYSKANQPPHMEKTRTLGRSVNCNYTKLRAFATQGWKDVPPEDRWWDKALIGLEERRKEGLKHVNQLVGAMEGLEKLCMSNQN